MACQSCRLQARLFAQSSLRSAADIASLLSSSTTLPARSRTYRVLAAPTQRRHLSHTRPCSELPRNTPSHPSNPTSASPPAAPASNFMGGVAETFRTLMPKQAGQYMVLHGMEQLYKTCAGPALYSISEELRKKDEVPQTEDGEEIGVAEGPWLEVFNLLPTFSTWSQVTMMHMYLIMARIRCLDRDVAKLWQHQFIDQYFFDCERMMHINHGMTSSALRQRYLKDIFVQWRGLIAAYDEGIARGDAVLASAVWRNLFKAREDVDFRHLAAIVGWMRATLRDLESLEDEDLVAFPKKVFRRDIRAQFALVDELSPQLQKEFGSGALGPAGGAQEAKKVAEKDQ